MFSWVSPALVRCDSLLGQSLGTELGNIAATVYAAIMTQRPRTYRKKPKLGSNVVHERIKKCVDHQMMYVNPLGLYR